MAITNHERVGKALELLTSGLKPFVERELKSTYQQDWFAETRKTMAASQLQFLGNADSPQWDVHALLMAIWNQWNDVFRKTLGHAERSLVSELREVRNRWAHQRPFSTDDAYRALDSIARLLTAVSASEASEVDKIKLELLRVRFDEQVRTEKRKAASVAIEGEAVAGLKPWREVVTPHKDVASGKYQQAEFAADLWQVYLGEGSDEYRHPVEFFRRTFLTRGPEGLAGQRAHRAFPARAATRSSSCRPISAAARRTRCWRSTTCSAGRPQPSCPAWSRSCEGRREQDSRRQARGPRRQQDFARLAQQEAGRHGGPHPLGRTGLATRRQGRLRAGQGRRPARHQPRRHVARAVQQVRAVPDPD